MKLIVDTGVFIAFFIKEDINHNKVVKKYKEYRKKHYLFFVSEYILDELFTRLIYDCGQYVTQTKIKEINKMIEEKELQLLPINESIFKEAQEIFIKFSEHKVSFTDATTYVLYKNLKLDEIFTLDSDFKKMRIKTSF